MARLFRRLMVAAIQGGNRYIRAVMNFVVGLKAKATTAPGAPIKSETSMPLPELTAKGQTRVVSDCRVDHEAAEVTLKAKMITWLVSTGVLDAKADISLTSIVIAAPAAVTVAVYRFIIGLTSEAQACPGIPTAHESNFDIGLTSEMEANPGQLTATDIGVDMDLTAEGSTAMPSGVISENGIDMDLVAEVKTVAPVMSAPFNGGVTILLTAKPHTWSPHEWVNETTLHIGQVYAAELDGNVLILK